MIGGVSRKKAATPVGRDFEGGEYLSPASLSFLVRAYKRCEHAVWFEADSFLFVAVPTVHQAANLEAHEREKDSVCVFSR